MATLTRWDPFREMLALRSTMDRVFDDSLQSMRFSTNENGGSAFSLAVDVTEDEDEYVVHTSTPGIAEDDIEITLENNILTVAGEFQNENEREEAHFLVRERRAGKFRRSITLPATVDESKVSANFNAGVLAIHLPKAEVAKPKRISVKGSKTINGASA